MKWVPFVILAVVTIVLQTTIVNQTLVIREICPDWMFILAVHYALHGPWPDVAIAAWILGLLVDLQTGDPTGTGTIGLFAFSYGLAACAILRIRRALFREHFVTHIVVTFIFAFCVQFVAQLYFVWRPPTEAARHVSSGLMMALLTAVYTAFCAPYLHWALLRLRRWTGLMPKEKL
jgi:rod shape-determining protein MreD